MNSKNHSRRSFLRLSVAGLGAALVAACGATPTATPTKVPPTATKAPAAPTAAPAAPTATKAPATPTVTPIPAPAKKVSLKFLSADVGGGQLEWMEKDLIPAFLKTTPAVEKIEIVATDWGKINEVLLAGFAAGDPPDVFEHGSSASGASWAASGQTLALDELFNALPDKADYYDVAVKTAYYKGKLYSLPRRATPYALVYRKDWFKEAGLDPDKPPTTWEDLRQAALVLTKKQGDNVTRAGYWVPSKSWDGIQSGWWPFLHQNGASILTDDLAKTNFDNEAGIQAMSFYHSLLWKDKVDVLGGIPSGIAGHPVAVGTAAMGSGSYGIVPIVKKNFPDVLPNIGVAPPTSRVRPGILLAVDRTFIALKSKSPELAWQFCVFKNKLDNLIARWKVDGGNIPPLKSFLQSNEAKADPLLQAFLKNIEVGYQWPPTPKWNDIRSYFTTMSDGFMAQAGDITPFVQNAAKEINAILAKQ